MFLICFNGIDTNNFSSIEHSIRLDFFARYVFDSFVGQINGELQLSTPQEIAEGVMQGKVHAVCNDCLYVIMTIEQLNAHRMMKPDHQLGWYKNE